MSMISSIRHLSATRYFNQFPSYCHMVSEAKKLARRSVLIDHCGSEYIDLKTGLNNIEQVYSIERETKRGLTRLSLVEFQTEDDAEIAARNAAHMPGLLPITLKFLQYNGRNRLHPSRQKLPFAIENIKSTSQTSELSTDFNNYTALIENNTMSHLELKLRFITLVNLERILCSGIFESYELMPFGSSVIDTGTNSGDLDLLLARKDIHETILEQMSRPRRISPGRTGRLTNYVESSGLHHIDKSLFKEFKDLSGLRGIMKWFEFILREYMPFIDGHTVLPIYHAKVPIIRFHTKIVSIDCDLSFDLGLEQREDETMSAARQTIPMTEAIYNLCRNSNIFTGLVIYLRIFAKLTAVTSKGMNTGMTNFQLLSLIIFYLQRTSITYSANSSETRDESSDQGSSRRKIKEVFTIRSIEFDPSQKPVLPSFKKLINSNFRAPYQMLMLDDDQLNQVLPYVIVDFFRFYSNFDFDNTTLNIYESREERKLDNSRIYVINPIDRTNNVCHNVGQNGYKNFVVQVRKALRSISGSQTQCPLGYLKSLIYASREEKKKATQGIFSTNEIAEDVCK